VNVNPNLSATAFLIADPARAAMLMSLVDGRARPAGELAYAAGVTPQTASSHLGRLLEGGLLTVEKQGRHRYYRLSDSQVAVALESLASVSRPMQVRHKPISREAGKLRFARCCYDHLAGKVGVAIARALIDRGFLVVRAEKLFEVTASGRVWFDALGVDVIAATRGRHEVARQCLDWTERQHHLAGPLGVALFNVLCNKGWLRRSNTSRSVLLTPDGWAGLREQLGLTPETVDQAAFP